MDESPGRLWAMLALVGAPAVIAVALPMVLLVGASQGAANLPKQAPGTRELLPGKVPAAYADFVTAAGAKCPEVSAPAIAAQLDAESGWNPNAVSPVGAQGIAQFMPGTWTGWGKDVNGDGTADPFDPADAISAQGDYMCSLAAAVTRDLDLNIVDGDVIDLTLAAYNAGLGNVEKYGGIPPFAETQGYVQRILDLIPDYSVDPGTGGAPLPGGPSPVIDAASQWLGYPYVWGGGGSAGPSGIGRDGRGPGFDCSGLTQYAVEHGLGVSLPRTADTQMNDDRGTVIPRDWSLMQPGDLIGFAHTGTRFTHIGIYLGDGKMLHAPSTGKNVEIVDLQHSRYYAPATWRILRFSK